MSMATIESADARRFPRWAIWVTVIVLMLLTPYPTGRKVSDKEPAAIHCTPDDFHGEWNYTIRPRS